MKEESRRTLYCFVYSFIQWTWGIVQNVIALFILGFLKLKDPKRDVFFYHGAVVTEWKRRSSMAMGMFIFLGHHGIDSYSRLILVHEYGHTIQSCILGPFYLFVIGIPSVLRATVPALGKNWREGRTSYYDFYPEKWANREGEKVLHQPSPGTPTPSDEM